MFDRVSDEEQAASLPLIFPSIVGDTESRQQLLVRELGAQRWIRFALELRPGDFGNRLGR
jgi:hypothetical protein